MPGEARERLNRAFGIADDPGCAISYVKVDNDTYWSGDPREGFHYNELVNIKDLPDLDIESGIEYLSNLEYLYMDEFAKTALSRALQRGLMPENSFRTIPARGARSSHSSGGMTGKKLPKKARSRSRMFRRPTNTINHAGGFITVI